MRFRRGTKKASDSGALHPELERLLVEKRITDVLVAYCQGVDRMDWQKVRSCYHDDAVDHHGQFVGRPDDLIAWIKGNHVNVTSSMHILTNVSMRFSEDGQRARVESYCLSLKGLASAAEDTFLGAEGSSGSAHRTVVIRYVDTFENRPGVGWRIESRHVAYDAVRRELEELYLPLNGDWTVSRRDRGDVLYAPLEDGSAVPTRSVVRSAKPALTDARD